MEVQVHLYTQSEPVTLTEAKNAYQKGDLYCVMLTDGTVQKFPLQHIFRVIERPTSK